MHAKRPGRFISFEGGEGAGKSTQIARLAAALSARGIDVVTTREPGGSPGADAVRALLVTGDPGRWDPVSEAFLVSAARRDHVTRVIAPALKAGRWVLCDRFADSTAVYQGAAQGVPAALLETLARAATDGLKPDLTVLLDLDPDVGLARAHPRGHAETRFERFDRAFHERVRAGFLALAEADPKRIRVIDAARPAEAVAGDVLALVDETFATEARP